MSDALELRAWRFLAHHRVGKLAVQHVTFIDDAEVCRMHAPSSGPHYEHGVGATFGEAAIALARALGMPCEDDSDSTSTASASDTSSVSTASRHNGASEPNLRPVDTEPAGSTTGAIGAGLASGAPRGRVQRNKKSAPD